MKINNCQNAQEYNMNSTQQTQPKEKVSIFLVDDGDNKFGYNNRTLLDNKINEWLDTSYSNYPKTLKDWILQQN